MWLPIQEKYIGLKLCLLHEFHNIFVCHPQVIFSKFRVPPRTKYWRRYTDGVVHVMVTDAAEGEVTLVTEEALGILASLIFYLLLSLSLSLSLSLCL